MSKKEHYFKFRKSEEPVFTDDFWYDLFDGGYVKPDELLADAEQALEVARAVGVLRAFYREAIYSGAVGEC